jgi:hypothetical protein
VRAPGISIRTEDNLVEDIPIRTRFDRDPTEPYLGRVKIWEREGYMALDVFDQQGRRIIESDGPLNE